MFAINSTDTYMFTTMFESVLAGEECTIIVQQECMTDLQNFLQQKSDILDYWRLPNIGCKIFTRKTPALMTEREFNAMNSMMHPE